MATERVTISGNVKRQRIAAGSKSDRVGVVLDDGAGRIFALRRAGGNPFSDPAMDELVGKTITATGIVAGGNFIMDRWDVVAGARKSP
jgi:hypothetical protein